jgi:hypothetical protein
MHRPGKLDLVTTVTLAALLQSRPDGPFAARDWLDNVLSRHVPGYTDDDPAAPVARSWSVGTVVGTETLVQARPVVSETNGRFLEDVLRTPAPCVIAAFATAPSAGPERRHLASVRMSRFQRWIGVCAETAIGEHPDAGEHTNALMADLPDFLAGSRTERSSRELLLFGFLAALHRAGALSGAYAKPETIRMALAEVDERLGHRRPFNMMVSDGKTLGVLHHGGKLFAMEPPQEALAPERRRRPPSEPNPTGPRAGLLILDPRGPTVPPTDGAERIAEGIFTLAALRPTTVERP